MKKILGLDVGTTSIGWAIVEATDAKSVSIINAKEVETDINNHRIGIYKNAVGVRIIPQDTDNIKSFNEGKKLIQKKTTTPTAKRRKARGSRRMKSRYKLRRDKLIRVLDFLGMLPEGSYSHNNQSNRWEPITNEQGKLFTKVREFEFDQNGKKKRKKRESDIGETLYMLRKEAINNGIDLKEWGRIILHLNQSRGYSSDRFKKEQDNNSDDDFYTSLVIDVIEKAKLYKGKKNPKVEKIVFEVIFENGDVGVDIVPFGENSYSRFKKDEFATYKKEINEKEDGTKEFILNWQKLKEDDWLYRKWKLNKGIDSFINDDKKNRSVGSYFYKFFYDPNTPQSERIHRIKNNVVNRDWYEDEFDKIWNFQFEKHKEHFGKIKIEDVVKIAFKDYHPILNAVSKKEDIKEQLRCLIKNKIIYYQRAWQQAKNKGECPFEFVPDVIPQKDTNGKKVVNEKGIVVYEQNRKGKKVIDKNGKEIYVKGRTVIPRSHPLYEEYKIWQQINNVRIYLNTQDEKIDLVNEPVLFEKLFNKTIEKVKHELFHGLNNTKTITWRVFSGEILSIKDYLIDDVKDLKKGFYQYIDEQTGKVQNAYFTVNFRKKKRNGDFDDIKLKGNTTKVAIQNILSNKPEQWLDEIHSDKQRISNFQLLWEIIYDITNDKAENVSKIIEKHFAFDKPICKMLTSINFDDSGMGNISAKAIRQLLPLMSDGKNMTEKTKKRVKSIITLNEIEKEKTEDEKLESIKSFVSDKKTRLRLSKFSKEKDFKYLNYWEAAAVVYGTHSTKKTIIQPEISGIKQHSLNNPIVEKIINEAISVVNDIYKTYGFDEVRIELSRELRASMVERQQMWEAAQEGYEKNEWAKKMLRELKQALKEDDRIIENIDSETSLKSNIDKIRIIEDVVKFQQKDEYKKKEKEFKLDEPSKAEITKYLLWLEQNFRCPYTDQPIPLTDVFARGKVVEIEHILPKERYYSNAYSNKVITWREVNQTKANNGNRTAYEFIVSKRVENSVKLGNHADPFDLVSADNWKDHIERMFPKGAKRNNLLRKEIPEDPVERTLKETQYINKKLKEKLAELVGESKVWVTSGSVTDILREKWHLNDVMKEILRERYARFNIGESKERLNLIHWVKEYNYRTQKYEEVEKFAGYSKRVDHRHHALDAIIIACTKQNHIQYINNLNAINTVDQDDEDAKKQKYETLKKEICEGNSSTKYKTPWQKDSFISNVENCINEIIVSHKNTNLLISPSKNGVDKNIKSGKVTSIRGELHKETNYAKKNYFIPGSTMGIDRLIPFLLKKKLENQLQTMVYPKSVEDIIKETVLKEKYQNILIFLFKDYEALVLNNETGKKANGQSISTIQKKILEEIKTKQLLIDTKTMKPLQWLSVFSKKDNSSRPFGLSMDLNNVEEIGSIANQRIKRLAEYRLKYISDKITALDTLDIDKKEKDKLKAKEKALKLYSNAIYEVRVKHGENQFNWVELKDLTTQDLNKISYANPKTTTRIKEKLKGYNLQELKIIYFEKPIFLSEKPIEVRKTRQISHYKDLYEITKNRHVYSNDVFISYLFVKEKEETKDANRDIVFLKFLDAIRIINHEKPDKIDYSKIINKPEHRLLFTLGKNDLVFLPETKFSEEQINEIDWNDKKYIYPKLFIVKDMNPSRNEIKFQQFYKADSISISEDDAKALFNKDAKNGLTEEVKYGDTNMWQRCIKVFTDRLGKKIVPYWEFPNGCWSKEKAIEIGLIKNGT